MWYLGLTSASHRRDKNGKKKHVHTVELKWLKHLWNHENMFETGVVCANEC